MKHWNEMSTRWHQDYERGRPSYPPQVVRVPGLPTSATALEAGTGTGKLTRLLVTELAHVLAVEPDPAMRRSFAMLCSGSSDPVLACDSDPSVDRAPAVTRNAYRRSSDGDPWTLVDTHPAAQK